MFKASIRFAAFITVFAALAIHSSWFVSAQEATSAISLRPNILWITSEDNGQELGCYGDTFADSPNIDALASRGMLYTNCWSNAPVCAPARTTLISGMFPTSLGAQHMRSEVPLPENVQLYPELLRAAGYYCTNNAKEDYNVEQPENLWDESSNKAHWRNRKLGQPFFAVFNFTISHESKIRDRPHTPIHDPSSVLIPPYHPDTPEVRQDWAQYYDRVTEMDRQVGRVLEQLKVDGLENNTIIFYYGDHGSGMPRSKRWLYESGLRVPLIVHFPERLQALAGEQYKAGGKSKRLVSFVDFVPTILSLTDTEPPSHLQGRCFLGPRTTTDPQYIYGFRDRMDERYDMSRSVRDDNYLYVRNFYPHRPQGAFLDYMFQTPTTRVWKQLFDEGKLNAAQSAFWLPKPAEELYDLSSDPYQTKNLAAAGEQQQTLERMRGALKAWMLDVKDTGLLPEGEMLDRSRDGAPRAMAQDVQRYPIEAIYAAADMATRPAEGDFAKLTEQCVSPESAVRYWVANGLLIRALATTDASAHTSAETEAQSNADTESDAARAEIVKVARGMTIDPNPYVRCVANEVMARIGSDVERGVAIKALLREANPVRSSTFVALSALNTLDWLTPTRAELGDALIGLAPRAGELSARYDAYIPRMAERINSTAE